MKNEKIVTAWNKMNPDVIAKERILQQLQDVLETDGSSALKRKFQRFAISIAAVFVLLLGSFGTAYAAIPSFRDYVYSLLFPLYASDEFVSIENGHMTGAFDKTDVLLSFLDRFNQSGFGNTITAAKTNGYHYSLFAQDDYQLQAFVDSSADGYSIVVYMERLAYANTEGIWQVTGYQILENTAAEAAKSQLTPYSESAPQDVISMPQSDASIESTETSVIIYNVNEKANAASLAEDDGRLLRDILESCDRLEHIEGGLFQYVVKINDITYLFDSKGNGMIAESAAHQGISISKENLDAIIELFERYDISLKETQ